MNHVRCDVNHVGRDVLQVKTDEIVDQMQNDPVFDSLFKLFNVGESVALS